MRSLILISMLVSIFLLFTIAVALVNFPVESLTSFASEETLKFTLKTVAICEDRDDSVYCHDELIINCEDEEYILPKTAKNVKCGEILLEAPPITAFGVFDKDWKDPRKLTE